MGGCELNRLILGSAERFLWLCRIPFGIIKALK